MRGQDQAREGGGVGALEEVGGARVWSMAVGTREVPFLMQLVASFIP